MTKKKEFAAAALDPEHETFVVHEASLTSSAGVYPSRRPQKAGLIAEEAPTKIPAEYLTLLMYSLRTWRPNSPSTLGSTTMLSNWSMPTDSLDHPSHPQVLPSFSTGSRTGPFGCVSIIRASITSRSKTDMIACLVSFCI